VRIGAALGDVNQSEAYAILLCDPITSQRVELGVSSLKDWGISNAKKVLALEKKTRECGFFIVTATHRTKRCHLTCWSQTLKSGSVSLASGISPAPIEVEVKRSRSSMHGSSWMTLPVDDGLVRPMESLY
jgi:hypothetical protein